MPSTNDYLLYVLELLREVDGISYRKMMGEYVLSKDGVIFGGIFDNRFLVKKVESLAKYELEEAIPYPKAHSMYLIDIENPTQIKDIVLCVYEEYK